MENKYYTPTIEEFYVGFQFEYNSEIFEDWKKCDNASSEDCYHAIQDISQSLETKYRVKYLDKDDIESLGFKEVEFGIYIKDKTKYDKYTFDARSSKVSIRNSIYNECWFWGTIKNKSELVRLLKQLDIE
jgi:hypothetical protein